MCVHFVSEDATQTKASPLHLPFKAGLYLSVRYNEVIQNSLEHSDIAKGWISQEAAALK